jgi:hypothetical protein
MNYCKKSSIQLAKPNFSILNIVIVVKVSFTFPLVHVNIIDISLSRILPIFLILW